MRLKSLFFLVLFFFALVSSTVVLASETSGTINENYSYAWGENIGWINLAPTNSSGDYVGVTVTDSGLSGYGWSQKYGWINFNPSSSGQNVTNTSSGSIGGSAWVSGLGWLDLSGISISSSGVFSGTAGTSGTTVGRVVFGCSNCDVRTDWRPASARTSASSGASSGGTSGTAGFISTVSSGVTNFWNAISLPWFAPAPSGGEEYSEAPTSSSSSQSATTTGQSGIKRPLPQSEREEVRVKREFSVLDYSNKFRLFWLIIILLCTFALWLWYRASYNK